MNDTDLRVFIAVSEKKCITVNHLERILKKNRSTVYQSLEKLIACNLCYKERKSSRTRGFVDYYHMMEVKEVFKKTEERLDTWYLKLKKIMRNNKKTIDFFRLLFFRSES